MPEFPEPLSPRKSVQSLVTKEFTFATNMRQRQSIPMATESDEKLCFKAQPMPDFARIHSASHAT
jgi:hypothetical protein